MEGKVFWIKYLENRPVSIKTHFLGDNERKIPLGNIDDLISAFKTMTAPESDTIPLDKMNLYLPAGTTRNDYSFLDADAFSSEDEIDTCLRSDLSLGALGSIGCDGKKPLIIKVIEGKYLFL